MKEVEKMYKNTRILPRRKCEFYEDCPLGFAHSCDDCDIEFRESNSSYPPFTAEKQIELIKWLLQNKRLCIRKAEHSNNFYMDTLFNRLDGVDNKDFEQCLASLVNNLWQDLTEEEKQQVKEILE